MKLEILYNGEVIGTLSSGQTAIVPKGKKFASDIVVRSVDVKAISFTIDGATYYAKEGVTWKEWVADTYYNADGFNFDGAWSNLVHKSSSYYVYNITTNKWASMYDNSTGETMIVPNQVYSLKYYEYGNGGSND